MNVNKRKGNEKKLKNWVDTNSDGRLYCFTIKGKIGGKAKF